MDNNNEMAKLLKIVVLVVVVAYVIAPIDLAPGPIDDIIVTIFGIAQTRKLSAARN